MKKLLILLIVPYSFVAAEVFEEEFPDGDLQEEYSLDGQACFDYIDNKGWSEEKIPERVNPSMWE